MTKSLSKYIDSFDFLDKSVIVFSAIHGSISVASFATVIGESFSLAFSIPTGIV